MSFGLAAIHSRSTDAETVTCCQGSTPESASNDLRGLWGLTIAGGDEDLHGLHGSLGVEGRQGVAALEEAHAVHAARGQRSIARRHVHLQAAHQRRGEGVCAQDDT